MKNILITFLVLFQISNSINDLKYNKKLIGSWELKYATLPIEKLENGIYKTAKKGTIGTTILNVNDDNTAVLNYPKNESYLFEWDAKKKIITFISSDKNYTDDFLNGTYSYEFNGKKQLNLKNDRMTICFIKKE